MRSFFGLFARTVHPSARPPLRTRLKLESLEDRTLPSADVLVGSIMASPAESKGVIDLGGTNLLSVPWDGQIGTDFIIPHSFGEVAAGSQGDLFFVGPYQGQDGVFKIDHATQNVSRVLDTQYDRIALGPGESVVGLLIPRVEIFPLSYSIQQNGQTVLTVIPKNQNPDPNAADNAINDIAVNAAGDIYFTGIYQGQDGVFRIDHATHEVSRVLTTSYQRIALAPNGDIVGSGISQALGHANAYIDVNGIRNVTLDNTTYPVLSAVAIGANQSLYFTGTYGGQTGVFRIDGYRNQSPATPPVVTRVSSTFYDNIAVESDAQTSPGTGNAFVSPQLSLVPKDPAAWVRQYGAGKAPAQAAQDYWNIAAQWGREVDGYYHSFLHRAADAAGRAFWISQLAAGTDETAVIQGFLTSAEYTQVHAGPTAYVEALYQDVLGRSADAAGEASWRAFLAAEGSPAAVVQGFLHSTEAVTGVVDSLYAAYLHRQADAAGRSFWVGQLQSSHQTLAKVAQAFLAAPEFYTGAAASNATQA
jgi:hypothetical protein